jgi:hypothetical protein
MKTEQQHRLADSEAGHHPQMSNWLLQSQLLSSIPKETQHLLKPSQQLSLL